MATFELPPTTEPRVSPQLLVGAASPLWTYFGAAASAGVAYWWMTRWTRPMNLEALFAGRPPAPELLVEVVAAEPEPVGGESAPVSPVLEALPEHGPSVEPMVEGDPVTAPEALAEFASSAELVDEPAPEVTAAALDPDSSPDIDPAAEAPPKHRARKAATSTDAEA